LTNGEGVIVIATPQHLVALESRLTDAHIDLATARRNDQYLALDARRTLGKFMMRNWPNDILFVHAMTELLDRAGKGGRRVRAFGEMVALLWDAKHTAATVRLEHLWTKICTERGLPLLCAYPRDSFHQSDEITIKHICASHSKVVDA
jgi:DcmR-like sensory protein